MHPHRPAASLFRLPRRTLRMQLALLYAGVFVILGVAMLAAAGLLVRSGSASGGSAGSAFNGGSPGAVGRQFDVGPRSSSRSRYCWRSGSAG